MDVCIDEPGHQDVVAMFDHLCIRWEGRQQLPRRPERRDAPVVGDQQTILEEREAAGVIVRAGIGTEMEDCAPMRARLHGDVSAERLFLAMLSLLPAPLRGCR